MSCTTKTWGVREDLHFLLMKKIQNVWQIGCLREKRKIKKYMRLYFL